MITVEQVEKKMDETVYDAEVVGNETVTIKKPFYKKPLFWLGIGVGSIIIYKLATKNKNGSNTLDY